MEEGLFRANPQLDIVANKGGVKFTPPLFFVQDYVSPNKTCRLVGCCQQGVALTAGSGAADLFGDDDTTKVVDPSYNACCFHFVYRYLVGASIARPLVQYPTAARTANGRPYNYFTNYAVILCSKLCTARQSGRWVARLSVSADTRGRMSLQRRAVGSTGRLSRAWRSSQRQIGREVVGRRRNGTQPVPYGIISRILYPCVVDFFLVKQ